MIDQKLSELHDGLQTAFIDGKLNSSATYRPEFLSNDAKQGKKVLVSVEEELLHCDEFKISVAFITMSGITPLLQTLKELEKRGILGKILTTDYLEFSDPKALMKLSSLQNVELRMYCMDGNSGGFHTKGYIFRQEEMYHFIIGSSNMTMTALTQNREWNTKIVATADGEMTKGILAEFEDLWTDPHTYSYQEVIESYRARFERKKQMNQKLKELLEQEGLSETDELHPNKMQTAFIESIKKLRKKNVNKALLLSSTGTGKTIASAFAVKEMDPKRILFVVHREQIAKQSLRSYKRIFGNTKTYGLLSGTSKQMDADFVFSTMQMMAKEEIYSHYGKEDFDVIILDECHHAGAESYQRIMKYFKPKFWLGMTASPDTNNYDIYSIFDHQIAYEIRLQQAMEEDLLCPFHYFGVSDYQENGIVIDDRTGDRDISALVSDSRVRYIIDTAEYYGYSGNRVKGLIFCSRKEEAKVLSSKFNLFGYRTAVLTGDDSQQVREETISKLTDDEDLENQLDYIFTVDIFNEGVDIPEVNQVLCLRPTESPVIFIQQLGRGLRKHEDKEYVVILDFIGNYMNNFMIPIALSGDRTYNVDNVRKYVISGNNVIPGASTIHFDEVTKARIFNSLDKIRGIKNIIGSSYVNLKNRLGRRPYLNDFYKQGEVDPLLIIHEYGTYDAFIKRMEKTYKPEFSKKQNLILEYLSKVVLAGTRPHELEILHKLFSDQTVNLNDLMLGFKYKYGFEADAASINVAINVLQGTFVSKQEEYEKYKEMNIFVRNGNVLALTAEFVERIKNEEFFAQVKDIVRTGMLRYEEKFLEANRQGQKLVLYEKYSRRDISYLMNLGKDMSSTMYGMKRIGEDVFIFVTYHKEISTDRLYVEGKPDYADAFEDNNAFLWDSQLGKGIDSTYMQDVIGAKHKHLFVKKDSKETGFYYMGEFDITEMHEAMKKDNNEKEKVITKVRCKMHQTVKEDLLRYLQSR